ncbi:hypothetical protein [Lacrimispora indolis]|uniref:hypothetical protein n=1 Tax=Lacrimispora indolis TaxID=69825 RepID=UPI0004629B97|nr:hypothetical protein [[Clostridium] methoxybenzovorans]
MKIKVSLPVILEIPDDRGEEILNGDTTSLLTTIYSPEGYGDNGHWWIQGECVVENGIKIRVL